LASECGRYAWANAAIHFARALGAARTGEIAQARRDVEGLEASRDALQEHKEAYWATQVEIQRRAATAWLAFAEGRHAQAVELMRSAADLEDTTDKHPVMPGPIVPARDLLGQLLVELDRPEEALAEFAKVLEAQPGRFGALYGAGRAAELAGRTDQARRLYAQLVEVASASTRDEVRHPGPIWLDPRAWRHPTSDGNPMGPYGRWSVASVSAAATEVLRPVSGWYPDATGFLRLRLGGRGVG
jgi:tetratricopeptide (TPR) repeat protein